MFGFRYLIFLNYLGQKPLKKKQASFPNWIYVLSMRVSTSGTCNAIYGLDAFATVKVLNIKKQLGAW